MIKITITSVKVDSSFAEEHTSFVVGEIAWYIIRDNGKRLTHYFKTEACAAQAAWRLINLYGLTLVEPW